MPSSRGHCGNPTADLFGGGDYARTMHELEAAVPPDRIAYFFFETLFTNSEMERLSNFLGIGEIEGSVRDSRESRANTPPTGRTPALIEEARKIFAHVYRTAHDRFGTAVPATWCD